MAGMSSTGPSMGPITPESGVIKDFKRIRDRIGKKSEQSPGMDTSSTKYGSGDVMGNQMQRTKANSSKWMLALKKKLAETRQTSRPMPSVSPRPVNRRPNTGAVDQLYDRSGAITPVGHKPDSRMYGHDASTGT